MMKSTENQDPKSSDEKWKHLIFEKTKRLEILIYCLALFILLLSSILFFQYDSSMTHAKSMRQTLASFSEARSKFNHKTALLDKKITRIQEKIDAVEERIFEIVNAKDNDQSNDCVGCHYIHRHHDVQDTVQPFKPNLRTTLNKQGFFEELSSSPDLDYVDGNHRSFRQLQANKNDADAESICDALNPVLGPLDVTNNFTYNEDIQKKMSILYGLSTLESLIDHKSPQYKAACWLIYDDKFKIEADDFRLIERYAVATFFYTQSEEGTHPPTDFCAQGSSMCSDDGHLIDVRMSGRKLESSIPSEFFNLFELEYLDLSGNFITGTIPPKIRTMTKLRTLNLFNNSFSGKIPTEIGDLPLLHDVKLNSNLLSDNIPSQIGYLSDLKNLELQGNNLSGSIPSQIFLCSKLQTLNVEENKLSGNIPTNFERMVNLESIFLSQNNLVGAIPSELGLASSLKQLWLRDNKLSGTLPQELSNLRNVSAFIVEKNQLSGNLHGLFDNFTSFWGLNIGSNTFSGKIPDSVWDIEIELGAILEANQLTGSVPNDYCSRVPFLKLDNSVWFQEPEIDCTCCNVKNCYMWDVDVAMERPICPKANIHEVSLFMSYKIEDLLMNQTQADLVGFGVSAIKPICVSPTGCYSIENKTDLIPFDGETEQYFLQYSSASNTLEIREACDAVTICGQVFDANDPKREGLNHLTQLVFPDVLNDEETPEYQALCWLLTADELYDQYNVCDGTLLQRFVLRLLLYKQESNHIDIKAMHTCDHPYIECAQDNKYVVGINMTNQGLSGSLNSEIGLLATLREINLSHNNLQGTLDPSTFSALPYLEVFNIAENGFSGEIPEKIFALPKLKNLDMSRNLLHGVLPNKSNFSDTLESFDLSNNLLQGPIPSSLLACHKLKHLDLSHNTFSSTIPPQLGELNELRRLMLNKNRYQGSIPVEIFNAINIEVLMLQGNRLSGSIPTQVGILSKLKQMSLSHNSFKGKIPSEIEELTNLELVQFHNNRLSGLAPQMKGLTGENSYITDCGVPSFLLQSRVDCPTCTTCCNSLQQCQKRASSKYSVWVTSIVFCGLVTPVAISFLMVFLLWLKKKGSISVPSLRRSSYSIYNESSVYCLILSNNPWAVMIYFLVAIIQALLYSLFLMTSDIDNEKTDSVYTMRCSDNSLVCNNDNDTDLYGLLLFFVVTLIFLGPDFVDSLFQLEKAVTTHELTFFISGSIQMFLCSLALYTTWKYNQALAGTNTELIVNTVILLFINDIDETFLKIIKNAVPSWVAKRYEDIERNLEVRCTLNQKERTGLFTRRMSSNRFIGAVRSANDEESS